MSDNPCKDNTSQGNFLILDSDYRQIESERYIEVPIKGPGEANRLVILNGLAISGADDPTGFGLDTATQNVFHRTVFINTKYRLADADRWQQIVNGNTDLLQASWLSLCAITADEEGGFVVALDAVTATINANHRLQLEICAGLQGDSTILKVAYQVNFLIKKAL